MAKYRVRDLTKVKQTETINLKAEQNSVIQSDQGLLPAARRQALNLKNLQSDPGQIWSNRSHRKMDSLSSLHSTNYLLVPAEQYRQTPVFRFQSVIRLAVSGLVIVFIINIFNVFANSANFKSILVSSASSGLDNLLVGVEQTRQLSHSQAQTTFQSAQNNFNGALEKISFLKTANTFSEQGNVKALENLLNAGKSVSEAGQLFSRSAPNLQEWPTLFIQANENISLSSKPTYQSQNGPDSITKTAPTLTQSLHVDLNNVQKAIDKIKDAKNYLDQVQSGFLPAEYQTQLPEIKARLDRLSTFLNNISERFPAILNLLGERYPHRYLILFQNDTEARPTGGFIGSLMIMDINDGLVTRADFHDVYQYDGQLNEEIDAPEEIASITKNWRLRDSNYSPDFAISAEKAAWFLQKSKGPSVDTVIAINQSAVSELLAQLGPIKVSPLKSELTADNFQMMLGYLIESKYFGPDNPKIILQKTIEAFKEKLLQAEDPSLLLNTLVKLVKDQKILFYSRDTDIQALFDQFNLTPHQAKLQPGEDYLQVLATSIGGNKSDLYMTQNITHTTFVNSDGAINDELTITRRHNWTGAELKRYEDELKKFGFSGDMPEYLQNILGKSDNKAMVKVYVPLGVTLENTQGLATDQVIVRSDTDLQKSYFLFPMQVTAGGEQTITLRYKLPNVLKLAPADLYRFTAQKQISIVQSQFKKVVQLAPALTLLKSSRHDSLTETHSEEVLNLHDDYRLVDVVAN